MSISSSIVVDLAVVMAIAAILTYIFHRLKQPLIVGYLIAGIIIGPYSPPFPLISNPEVVTAAADLGVILLLFGIGLDFPISRLRTVGKVSAGVAGIEIAFMFLLSFGITRLLGWPLVDALFLGTALASSSTTIIAKVLTDMGKLKELPALIMLGVLVVEDLIVVALLAFITSILGKNDTSIPELSILVVKIIGFVGGSLVLGHLIIPRIINHILKLNSNEVFLLVILGMVFGISILGNFLGFSMAIGAFLMGVIVASSDCVDCVTTVVASVRDMFAAVFFVSVGALIDITQFQAFLWPSLIITVLMVFGKVIGCGGGTKLFGYDNSTAFKVGLGMSQIGEFAFIVMIAGRSLNLISPFLFSVVGVAAGITTFLTPYLIKFSYRVNLNNRKVKK